MNINIPDTDKKRVVIIGGGFAGINMINKLDSNLFQTVLLDKNNYHQFHPLLYQVASSGLQISSIIFPFRKLFRKHKDFYFRLCDVTAINAPENTVTTSIGDLSYDYLVIAGGAKTNFYGNKNVEEKGIPMKEAEDALTLKNDILLDLEKILDTHNRKEKEALLNICIVGGGATGVEIAGALAEMKQYVIPKDYPDLQVSQIKIYLLEGSGKLLSNMSEEASENARKSLEKMGVTVLLNKLVVDYKDNLLAFKDGETIPTSSLIWVSGITANIFEGINKEQLGKGNRIIVDEYNLVKGLHNVFAIGDICLQTEENYPNGHPQVAPVAIQQGKLLAKNLKLKEKNQYLKHFHYKNKGTLATIGRNKAVADLNNIHLHGFSAWIIWIFVHLRSILGVKNKIEVLIDWVWNYFSFDWSSRYIINVKKRTIQK